MNTIKISSYDKMDLVMLLRYCKEKKLEDLNNDKINIKLFELDMATINNLLKIFNKKLWSLYQFVIDFNNKVLYNWY